MENRWNAPVHMVVQVPGYDSAGPNNGHFGLYGHGEQGNPGKVAVATQIWLGFILFSGRSSVPEMQWIKRAQKRGKIGTKIGGPKRVLNCRKVAKTKAFRRIAGNPRRGKSWKMETEKPL
jgi:hypothetical protein